MPFLIKPIILYFVGVFLLRLSGKRSLAQMTISQTILIIALGHIIVEPFADKDVTKTVTVAVILTILLILFEYVEFYFKNFKKIIVGEKEIIVQNGIIDNVNMKKLKLTNDELYSRLRQKGIEQVQSLKEATLETNGELGYKLDMKYKPLTYNDIDLIVEKIVNRLNSNI